jgi:D-alanyl-lipoteichoic acid acyltransferase DltB (MBOAT superfamily)
MKYYDREIARETLIHVLLGTLVNFPLNIFFTWLVIVQWGNTEPLVLSITLTAGISVVAFTRIYIVRTLTEKRKKRKKRSDSSVGRAADL